MRSLIVTIISILLVSGCAETPHKATHDLSYQRKWEAAEHWQIFAAKFADEVKLTNQERRPVYVPYSDRSTFGVVFHSTLITELINRGIPVSYNERDNMTVNWAVEPVKHEGGRHNVIGILEGAGLLVTGVLFGGVDKEIISPPNSEVFITASLYDGEFEMLRESGAFYVNDADIDHYARRADKKNYAAPSMQSTFILVNE